MSSLLLLNQLRVSLKTTRGPIPLVHNISFSVDVNQSMALVGESGCGKTVTALCLIGLLPKEQYQIEGEALFNGLNLVGLREPAYRALRGSQIAMVFQEAMSALNPTMKIGWQVVEALARKQRSNGRKRLREEAIALLESVGIQEPDRRFAQFPHQLSGGMRQRVLVAIALASEPSLLIADEPTTALDPLLQEQVLEVVSTYQKRTGMSVLLISHDLRLVARHCTHTLVMYAGRIVESGPTSCLLEHPHHPYTQGLINSLPSLEQSTALDAIPGSPPTPGHVTSGCPFSPRCPHAMHVCTRYSPPLDPICPGHRSACWLHDPRAAREPS